MDTFKHRVTSALREIKTNEPSARLSIIPVHHDGKIIAYLRAVTRESIKEPEEITFLARWRKQSETWFPTQFRVTKTGTKKWAQRQLIGKTDRVLFMIENLKGVPLGHVGLNRFDFGHKSCEIDNIIRGEKGIPGLMTASIRALCAWGKTELGIKTYYLQCFGHNAKALALYKRCGFKKSEDLPNGMIRMKKI